MSRSSWLRSAWHAASETDTVLSWLGRLGLLKVGVAVALGIVTFIGGVLEGFRWPIVAVISFFVFVGALWLWNGILYQSNQRRLSRIIRSGELHAGAPEVPKPEASARELEQSTIRGRLIWIGDLLRSTAAAAPVIHDRTFEDCDIYGPAVVVILTGTSFTGGGLSAHSGDDGFIEIPSGLVPQGVIGLERCSFRGCRLFRIAIAAPASDMPHLRSGFGLD